MDKNENCCIVKSEEDSLKSYWESNYEKKATPNWIETQEPWITKWILNLGLPKDATFFCAGVGDANIVDTLVNLGFTNIIANDISQTALNKLSNRVQNSNVRYVQDDLVNPKQITEYFGKIDVYIDRATLHFFTTCPEKDHYFSQMKSLLKTDGHAIIGVFSKDNKARCCGLDLQLWSSESLKNRMNTYDHHKHIEIPFTEINGNVRNYIYLIAQNK